MKIYGKVILLVAAAVILVPAMAFAVEGENKPADNKAGANQPERPWLMPGMMQGPQFPILQSEAFKDEMARHKAAIKDIKAPLADIRKKLGDDFKALREQYFPKPAEGEEWTPPDPDKIKEYGEKVKALVEKAQTDNEAALKGIAGKIFDEFITHQQNIIKIAQDNKDKIIDANWKKLLAPPMGFGRWGKMHRMGGKMGGRMGMMHGMRGHMGGHEGPAPGGAPGPGHAPGP
jgi:hypothetical protein